jgi:hypothetical protein
LLIEFTKDSYQLAPGKLISLRLTHRQTLQIEGDRVWLTIEGDAQDHWLQDGDSLSLPGERLIVIEADRAASTLYLQKPQNIALTAGQIPVYEETIA